MRARGHGLSPPERSTVWSGEDGAAGEGMPQAYRGCHRHPTHQIALCSLAMAVAFIVTLACILATVVLAAVYSTRRARPVLPEPPGPVAWPIIGNLHLLGNYGSPFEAFSALGKRFGDIYRLKMGTVSCVVLNNYAHIKEVLITKGADFGGRPDFLRFHRLFGGDRNNSLALCDWSDLQKTRRAIARAYCSPRIASAEYDDLVNATVQEMDHMVLTLKGLTSSYKDSDVDVKPVILAACANTFIQYMCSTRFDYDDAEFSNVVHLFDEIFWEINQGYAVDFLPWLHPMYETHLGRLSEWATIIRSFIMSRIVEEHRNTMLPDANPRDFTDALLQHLAEDKTLSEEHIMFELEDFLGGHSGVANLAMLTLGFAAKIPAVTERIRAEVNEATNGERPVSIRDKDMMPYTEATILETLRICSSPIVPHVATVDTSIGGYSVPKDTVVFLNNLELNTSTSYWEEPQSFRPERFLHADKDGRFRVVKPSHFIPFSTGKRTCIGQRLVQGGCFAILSSVIQNFEIEESLTRPLIPPTACVALPPAPLAFTLRLRPIQSVPPPA